ncbi:hypothetical protein [Methylobacterium sp. WL120]|uniref:hypothetical protein n=1 Tax=Methylobacterium sp. WL120 TaxID=2603887 RepID=UPI0011C88369|nr:hypothetical protein [Methylobacterium sp. WL120]TXM68307.1 hypothetical protein FV229_08025 [Methylobacterium sp. WL120]
MSPDQQYGVIEQRFRNIEGQVTDLKSSLSSQIATIAAKLDERGKPQWQLMVSAIGVMMTILIALGALIYMPIKAEQLKTDTEITRLREQVVPRSEHDSRNMAFISANEKLANAIARLDSLTASKAEVEDKFKAYGLRRDDFQKTTDNAIARLQRDLDELQKEIVPRGEHDKIWRGFEQRDADLQRQIDETKKAYEGTFSLRDALQLMQKRIDSLESTPSGKR